MSSESTTSSSDFYTAFQRRKNELIGRISSCEDAPPNSIADALKQLTSDTQLLRKETVEATSYLPAHDRKTLENQLADLESRIQKLRQRSAPKGKFLFKKSTPTSAGSKSKILQTASKEEIVAVAADTSPPVSQMQLKSNEYISADALDNEKTSSGELTLIDLEGCIVDLLERPHLRNQVSRPGRTALHAKNIRNSVLALGDVDGSVMLHNLERCTIVLKCHQLRVHNSKNLVIYLEVPSDSSGIIEGCSNIIFANIPKDVWLSSPEESDEVSASRPVIQDFSHIMSSTSPNWSFVGDERVQGCQDLKIALKDGKLATTEMPSLLLSLLPPQH
ncbi:hypothetical protein SCHPADRAFT_998073 [Schizopora paradoxa]|uniref:C-CAP/cofactor C-like domain-containing protein n=1 Tax=Schizopora paradoxa TaxID=27342 RepID=A0A0H2RSS7_9AGAM|nr:hypothetical protein SCHPADRAFT_998073 [Schizopora paradoxa]